MKYLFDLILGSCFVAGTVVMVLLPPPQEYWVDLGAAWCLGASALATIVKERARGS